MIKPILDKEFKSAIIEYRNFLKEVHNSNHKNHLTIAVERNDNLFYRKAIEVFKDGYNDEKNFFFVERMIKSILWVVGGFKIYIHGSKKIFEQIKKAYYKGGVREFDYNFMSQVYEREMEVVYIDNINDMPSNKENPLPISDNLNGHRIGFDAGGSDIKISAIKDGEVIYSEEVVWLPKLNEDISYHYDYIYKVMKMGIDKLGGKCDGIGISSAGVIIANRPMVSSLFIKVPKKDFEKVKQAYIYACERISKELGHYIPYAIANDGDVTALAGAKDIKDTCVLGIAMGTSEAVGYVNRDGNLTGWINELAFVPIDFNPNALIDEWSGDIGVGCKYLSQDAVIKLAPSAGIDLDDSLTLAEKLKVVQKLNNEGHEGAKQIFESIGVYLANAIAYYSEFYEIKHVLLLGRVTSGVGGDIILRVAKETLEKDFKEYANITLEMPSEYMRRVGQSIAVASLAK